jgi:hypothetical protein
MSATSVRSIGELSSGPGTPVGICAYRVGIENQNILKNVKIIYFIASICVECRKNKEKCNYF